jgi:SpoVK/Ycf46/Vps4 family AAA+-type ATPase
VLQEGTSGVNIYLYGAPGTGKSELARVLAKDAGAALFEVSSEDCDGDPEDGKARIVSLRMAQALIKEQRALVVFDEAEDIFSGKSFNERSIADQRKGWMNRMLESNPVPTIWISNSGRGLDPAFMRRFDFVFEVSAPPIKQRCKVLQRICAGELSTPVMERLAGCDELTPAVVARAHAVANRVSRGDAAVDREQVFIQLIRETLKAQGHSTTALDRTTDVVPALYDTAFLNCDKPLDPLIASLHSDASCRICLYGPPGTGKTCLGHWLAGHLGKPLILKKASDILSPFLGMTERKLAEAFEEAREDKAILLIDEVDTFLQDRRRAQRPWEVSEVNEMLTQMEQFEGIFIASTNLVDGLDRAALRRFDLKLRFDFLLPDQVRALLESHCRHLAIGQPSIRELNLATGLANLTPGDFANVARQHRFRHFTGSTDFIAALEDECRMKDGGSARAVGFF